MFVSLQNWAGPKQAVPCPHNLTASGVSQGTEENREGTSRWDWGNLGKWGLCSGQNWIFQLQNDVYLQSFGLLPQSHPGHHNKPLGLAWVHRGSARLQWEKERDSGGCRGNWVMLRQWISEDVRKTKTI